MKKVSLAALAVLLMYPVFATGEASADSLQAAPQPTASLTQSAATTTSNGTTGEAFTISWSSTNASSCTVQKSRPDGAIINPWATGISGSQNAPASMVGTHHWWIDCKGSGGTAHADLYHSVVAR